MRPGQAAPVFGPGNQSCGAKHRDFNEAGAGCPGILGRMKMPIRPTLATSMRPGQAAPVFLRPLKNRRFGRQTSMRPGQAAPVFERHRADEKTPALTSMRPGQAAPVFDEWVLRGAEDGSTSMRPGQAAPVFRRGGSATASAVRHFNEAGAGCPGIPTS